MAKKITELDNRGQVVSYRPTRAQRKSEQRLIPLTPAPRTRWQKIKKAAVG